MINLEDSINGTNRSLTLQKPYVNEKGHALTKLHALNVKISKGVIQGQ
ncbi:MAG: curved DNA-binding protein [Enterobacterales bacterium]|jgi:curved DNA-binding protein